LSISAVTEIYFLRRPAPERSQPRFEKSISIFGGGKGDFRQTVVATGYDSHESKVAGLDGNGTLVLLIKPYNWQTPAWIFS
jgi:hypothetical protein